MSVAAVFGLPTLTVLELSFMLKHLKITHGIVRPSGLERVVDEVKLDRTPVVFSSGRCFAQTRDKFKIEVTALVVDSPVVLHKEYQLPLIGAEISSKSVVTLQPSLGFKDIKQLITTDFGDVPVPIERVAYNPIADVLKLYNASSLGALQTQLYRVKDLDVRAEVNTEVRNYFLSRMSIDRLESRLTRVAGPKVSRLFIQLLSAPDMQSLRSAVHQVKASPDRINTVAKKLKISPFDIKYLLSARS